MANRESASDAKGIVNHVGRVHLTLLAICIAVGLGLLEKNDDDTSEAIRDLSKILSFRDAANPSSRAQLIMDRWLLGEDPPQSPIAMDQTETESISERERGIDDPNWLLTLAQSAAKQQAGDWRNNESLRPFLVQVLIDGEHRWIQCEFGDGLELQVRPLEIDEQLRFAIGGSKLSGGRMEAPDLLGEFKVFWNRLRWKYVLVPIDIESVQHYSTQNDAYRRGYQGRTVSGLRRHPIDKSSDVEVVTLKYDSYEPLAGNDRTPRTLKIRFVGHLLKEIDGPVQQSSSLESNRDSQTQPDAQQQTVEQLYVWTHWQPIDLDAQGFLSERAGADWLNGSFETSFPELNRLTIGLDAVALRDLLTLLREARSRSRGTVVIAGMKIQGTFAAILGALAVVLVQSYLFVHMCALRTVLANEGRRSTVGWYATYRGAVPFVCGIASLGVVPAAVAVLLYVDMLRYPGGGPYLFVVGSLASGILVISVLCTRTLIHIRVDCE